MAIQSFADKQTAAVFAGLRVRNGADATDVAIVDYH